LTKTINNPPFLDMTFLIVYILKNKYIMLLQEIIKMDAFQRSEETCKRMFKLFSKQFVNDKLNPKLKYTKDKTLFDAGMTYTKNDILYKAHLEFKVRETLYEEMFIEPKNVKHANEIKQLGIEYIYINFYDDKKTKIRHMYCWSSNSIDFNNLTSEMKSIAKTEVADSQMQYQKRYLLPLNKATEHYQLPITELFPECSTEEYLDLWRENFFKKK